MGSRFEAFGCDRRWAARAGLLLGIMVTGAARGQTTQPRDEGRWEAVVRGFQSERFAEREAAQKVLDTATVKDIETLRGLAEKATDAEVKARLENRVEALKVELLVHLPKVTLEVKNAGIKELAAALSAATGTKWTAWDRGAVGGPWTLKAQERPLWEIFRSLEKQAAVHVQNSGQDIMLAPGPMIPGGLGPIDGDWTDVVAGDFLIYVGIGRELGPVGLHAAGAPAVPTVKVEYGVRGDPRMRLVRCAIPDILSVVDENGKVLYAGQPRATPNWFGDSSRMAEVNTAMGFDDVPGMGKRLTIKGQMAVRRATAAERVEVAVTQHNNAAVQAGGRVWHIWAVEDIGRVGWVINVTAEWAGAGAPLAIVPMSVKVTDAGGKVVWDGVVDRQISARVQPGEMKLPLKAEFVAAKESADEVVPFEIKDVRVPGAK